MAKDVESMITPVSMLRSWAASVKFAEVTRALQSSTTITLAWSEAFSPGLVESDRGSIGGALGGQALFGDEPENAHKSCGRQTEVAQGLELGRYAPALRAQPEPLERTPSPSCVRA